MLRFMLFIFFLFVPYRLLDVCYGVISSNAEINLTLVFEYVEQDLSTYLQRCPSPGLGPDRIKVSLFEICNVIG